MKTCSSQIEIHSVKGALHMCLRNFVRLSKRKMGKMHLEECPPGATGFSPKMGANSAASLKLVTRDCKYCQAPSGNTNTNTLQNTTQYKYRHWSFVQNFQLEIGHTKLQRVKQLVLESLKGTADFFNILFFQLHPLIVIMNQISFKNNNKLFSMYFSLWAKAGTSGHKDQLLL